MAHCPGDPLGGAISDGWTLSLTCAGLLVPTSVHIGDWVLTVMVAFSESRGEEKACEVGPLCDSSKLWRVAF